MMDGHFKNSKKTVLQIIDSLNRGGAQKVVLDIVRNLPEYNHIVCFWSRPLDLKEEFEKEGALIIQIPFPGMYYLPITFYKVKRIVRQYKVNFIHSHMFTPNLLAEAASKYVVRIRTYHGETFETPGLKGWLIRKLDRFTLHTSHQVIAVSKYVKDYIQQKLNTKANIDVVYNYAVFEETVRERKFDFPIRIVATSNNQSYKNYPLLIEAFEILKNEPVQLHIYGKSMGPLMEKARQLNLQNVFFHGSVPDVTRVLPDYDIYIATSRSGEGFSLALLEAMHAGLPIVCSDIPQFVEAVAASAFIFKNNDVNDLVKTIRLAIRDSSKLCSCSKEVLIQSKNFTRERFQNKLREIYNRNGLVHYPKLT